MTDRFSFCKSVYAKARSPWHIRKVTDVGCKSGGRIDTPSLCGRVKQRQGWDLDVEISEHHLRHACKDCVEEYLRREP